MSQLNTPTIYYVDAPPGIGKTRAAINYMIRHIEAALDNKKVGYLFYVFPSHDLGDQTRQNLRDLMPARYHRFLFSVGADDQHDSHRDRTETKVYNILSDRGHAKRSGKFDARTFLPGSILFMAHPTFLKLRKHEKFKDTTVVFDEARNWVTPLDKIDLASEKNKLYFQTLFDERPLMVNGEPHAYLHILTPRSLNTKQRKMLANQKATDDTLKMDSLHSQLMPKEDDYVRMRVYSFRRGNRLMKITMPYYPFAGFKQVLILAADFARSQMYHLLRLERARTKDRTEVFIDTYTDTGYWEALRIIRRRTKHLTLLPLLAEPGVGSKYQYRTGIVLPAPQIGVLKRRLADLGMRTGALQQIVQYMRNPDEFAATLKPVHYELLRTLEEVNAKTNILEWQVSRAVMYLKKWRERYPCKTAGVLFVNKPYEEKFTAPGYDYMSIGKVEGKNEYMESNAVAFLAAVNPSNEIAELLHTILPNYDADEDFVVNKAVQCIGRGNIRNHNSRKKMLAIVSTEGLAERIRARMEGAPKISDVAIRTPDKTHKFWSDHVARTITKGTQTVEGKRKKQKEAGDKYKEDPLNRELIRLRNRRSRIKARLARNDLSKGDRRQAEDELKRAEADLAATTQKRDKAKKAKEKK